MSTTSWNTDKTKQLQGKGFIKLL